MINILKILFFNIGFSKINNYSNLIITYSNPLIDLKEGYVYCFIRIIDGTAKTQ